MTRTGLALGKFAPFHKGHELLLDTVCADTDRQVFVIYDSPHVTNIPLRVRANWIRQRYPNAEVLEVWNGPTRVGLAPDVMEEQVVFLKQILGKRRITHFYSSEAYGPHVAMSLGAVNVQVDEARQKYPTSGTEIRKDYFTNREFISHEVYRDLILKAVFLGAPGSGKSTTVEAAASLLNTNFMPEYGREYWEKHQKERRLTLSQLEEISIEHRLREDKLVLESNKQLVIDTDASTTLIFSEYYHGKSSPTLSKMADEALSRYDVTFLCLPDFPYIETEDRSGDVVRQDFHSRICDYLKYSKRPFVELGGSLESRLNKVVRVLNSTSKYPKLIDGRSFD